MMQAQPSSVATRNGVIAGVLLGVLSLPVIALSAVGRAAGLGGGLRLLFLLAALVAFAVAGFSASRRNSLLRSGVWAGALAGLITAFIALCLGVVILTLLAPYALLAATHAPLGRRVVAGVARAAFLRLFLSALLLAVCGLVAGLIGGLLGRIGQPRGANGQGAPYVASPPPPQPQGYAPSATNAQAYTAGVYTPTPQTPYAPPTPTPTPYYPTAVAYDDSAPTTIRDSQV